ncbi:uncharacterized protein LOC127809408 [Diospyros lotus]|uniref:uncharacterized protein LOC127809408 n=1 Tax=Diospyros lotus TaxID=55363 RepID=UPI00225A5CB8|nr:uncharacterized protein LOC127809408 [Diospyros lotus]
MHIDKRSSLAYWNQHLLFFIFLVGKSLRKFIILETLEILYSIRLIVIAVSVRSTSKRYLDQWRDDGGTKQEISGALTIGTPLSPPDHSLVSQSQNEETLILSSSSSPVFLIFLDKETQSLHFSSSSSSFPLSLIFVYCCIDINVEWKKRSSLAYWNQHLLFFIFLVALKSNASGCCVLFLFQFLPHLLMSNRKKNKLHGGEELEITGTI